MGYVSFREGKISLGFSECSFWCPIMRVLQILNAQVMLEQSSFCDCVCKSPETQIIAKLFAEDNGASDEKWWYPDVLVADQDPPRESRPNECKLPCFQCGTNTNSVE